MQPTFRRLLVATLIAATAFMLAACGASDTTSSSVAGATPSGISQPATSASSAGSGLSATPGGKARAPITIGGVTIVLASGTFPGVYAPWNDWSQAHKADPQTILHPCPSFQTQSCINPLPMGFDRQTGGQDMITIPGSQLVVSSFPTPLSHDNDCNQPPVGGTIPLPALRASCRVLGYLIDLTNALTLDQAKQLAQSQLPDDAQLVGENGFPGILPDVGSGWGGGECLTYKSTIAAHLPELYGGYSVDPLTNPDGLIFVMTSSNGLFHLPSAQTEAYDAGHIFRLHVEAYGAGGIGAYCR